MFKFCLITTALGLLVSGVELSGASPTSTVRASASSILAGQQVTISVDATDGDGNLRYLNVDQISPTDGFYGPGDTGTETPPNNGWYDLGGYYGSRTRDLVLTLSTPGTYVFRGAANDESGWYYSSNTVTVTVNGGGNVPPTCTVRASATAITAGQTVIISVDGADSNGNLHYLNVDQVSPTDGYYGPGDSGTETPPNNGWYDLGGYHSSRTRDLTLMLNAPGTYTFRGAANDDSGWYYSSNTVTVTVSNPTINRPPTCTIRANTTTITTGQTVAISVDGSDLDGNLHYINVDQTSPVNGYYGPGDNWTESPPNNGWYNLGGFFSNRTRTLNIQFNNPGSYTFRGAANDDSGWYYSSNTVTILVSNPPQYTVIASDAGPRVGTSFNNNWIAIKSFTLSPQTTNSVVVRYDAEIQRVGYGSGASELLQLRVQEYGTSSYSSQYILLGKGCAEVVAIPYDRTVTISFYVSSAQSADYANHDKVKLSNMLITK